VTALKWGRAIFENIRRLLQFKLSTTIVALLVSFIGSVFFRDPPIHSIQLLWINLIMEILAPLSVSIEKPSPNVLNKKPINPDEMVLTPGIKKHVVVQTLYQTSALLFLFFWAPALLNIPNSRGQEHWTIERGVHNTIVFHTFFFMIIFNEFDCRKDEASGYFTVFIRSQISLVMTILRVLLQIFFVEFGGVVLKCSPLTFFQHIFCAVFGLGTLICGYIARKLSDSPFESDIFLEQNRRPLPFTDTLIEGLRANRQRIISN
jgi:Ca2+-transporting ATPase